MKIESIRDLKKVIALCRSTGVQSIRVDGIEMHLGDEPVKESRRYQAKTLVKDSLPNVTSVGVTDETKIEVASEWDMLTEEQKLNWSVQPEAGNEQ